MEKEIFWNEKNYACEFIKSVKVEGSEEINGQFSIYINRNASRAFLVTEFGEVIAQSIVFYRYELDAILDCENKYHEKEINKLCKALAQIIYLETWDEVTIK